MKPPVYHRFRRTRSAPPTRNTVAMMVLIAALLTGIGIQRVRARHEVIRAGYELTAATDEVRTLREARRQLEIERATLANPARIRALATALGMQPVPPDQIRVVPASRQVAVRIRTGGVHHD